MVKRYFFIHAKKVEIKAREEKKKKRIRRGANITVTLDSEPIGILPATFQVIENALTIRM